MDARLQVGKVEFAIVSASLEATLADPSLARRNGIDPESLPLLWLLRVVAAERSLDGQPWAPTLEVIDLLPRIARWTQLGGWMTAWGRDDADPAVLEPQATLVLLRHETVRDNALRLGRRLGAHFALGWHGVVDLQGEPPFDGRLPIVVSGDVRFTGITVDSTERETDAEVRARLARRIDLDGLRALPREVKDYGDDDGVRVAQLRFLPVEMPPDAG